MSTQTIKFWKTFATKVWAKKKPPYKPSKGEIKFWEKIIKKVAAETENPKVLILGATPEFRDMLAKYPIDVILLDINQEMKKAMDDLLKTKPMREKFIKGDWLDMPFNNESFDVVMGDTPHHNIKKSIYHRFFSQIKRALKKDGYFLLSSCFFSKSQKGEGVTLRQFLDFYKKNPKFFMILKIELICWSDLARKFFIITKLGNRIGRK